MFFDILSSLCSDAGITPTKLVMDLGISKSNVTNWRIGKVPKSDTVQKIAAYFGVSTDYLLGNTDIKNKPAATEDDELLKNPEMREALIWFRSHSPEDQKRALNLLKALDIPPEPPKDK
ncbi:MULTISPECIES: helix-turn-helix domain-containing protein [Anaerotruncus]|jgi:transcriptional regulator with XRE-family HTH domain|uniref:helix-turn-helix domain-containing protein n=1 Tax=Anaerotruncus TaxID=244127 RepID=UPI00083736FF|nr:MULTISPECIES: helix-turn-helix transcriptional regulator [Anaerotruncus]RGX52907.1 XRE family transcriptional regulator [Anaerotruncus sp. AF02-27]